MNAPRLLSSRRAGSLRRLAWLSAVAMLALSALAPASSYAAGNDVKSITVPSCIEGVGISGTLDVTVVSAPFVFDIWVTDHKPGESDFVEIPGSRTTLSISSSDSSYAFGPLNVSQHRDGVNTYRVESDGSTAKSASIHPCDGAPSNPPSTPPSNPPSTPPSNPPSTPPSNPPSNPPSTPPSTPPSQAPSEEPTSSVLPIESTQPETQPSGDVLGVVGTPRVTPPPTDAVSDATTSSGSWRIVLAGMAILIVTALLFTQPTRARRSR
jgi:hypothetical protein